MTILVASITTFQVGLIDYWAPSYLEETVPRLLAHSSGSSIAHCTSIACIETLANPAPFKLKSSMT